MPLLPLVQNQAAAAPAAAAPANAGIPLSEKAGNVIKTAGKVTVAAAGGVAAGAAAGAAAYGTGTVLGISILAEAGALTGTGIPATMLGSATVAVVATAGPYILIGGTIAAAGYGAYWASREIYNYLSS